MTNHGKGTMVAAAVAALFSCASADAAPKKKAPPKSGEPVNCAGINSCKGQGSCAGNDNACKAMNSCKGKGYIEVATADECKAKGGTVAEKKM